MRIAIWKVLWKKPFPLAPHEEELMCQFSSEIGDPGGEWSPRVTGQETCFTPLANPRDSYRKTRPELDHSQPRGHFTQTVMYGYGLISVSALRMANTQALYVTLWRDQALHPSTRAPPVGDRRVSWRGVLTPREYPFICEALTVRTGFLLTHQLLSSHRLQRGLR